MTRRRAIGRVVAATCALSAAFTGAALALPPGGAVEEPGTPPGVVSWVASPAEPKPGAVHFCVENYRVETSSGPVAQQFMVKFDDHGNYGIGPFTPTAGGALCGAISTNPAAYAKARGGAADKLPSDLCDTSKDHWLRFLSGPWAHPQASMRSQVVSFTPPVGCGSGWIRDEPSGGQPPPPTPTPGSGGGEKPVAVPRLASKALSAGPRRVAIRLRATSAVRGALVLRTARKLRVGKARARVLVLAKGRYAFARPGRATVRLRLTPKGRALVRRKARIGVRLTLVNSAPATGRRTIRAAVVRRAISP